MNLSHYLIAQLRQAMAKLQFPEVGIALEEPPEPVYGDRSCAIALTLSKQLKRPPRQIAQEIQAALVSGDPYIGKCEIAGPGYLNFFWSEKAFILVLRGILEDQAEYGASKLGAGQRHLYEFVSANPTGPMNVVSARAAAVGDSSVRLAKKIGFEAHSEYYVNDAGRQIEMLGLSVQARIRESQGQTAVIPEGGYHGEYVKEIAALAMSHYQGDPLTVSGQELGRWTAHQIAEQQKNALAGYGVTFDRWFFENELHKSDRPQKVLKRLTEAGLIYEKEGALFLKTTQFGDDEDRVVMTSEGRPTYFLPDIAYHLDKAGRGFVKVIDLLGS